MAVWGPGSERHQILKKTVAGRPGITANVGAIWEIQCTADFFQYYMCIHIIIYNMEVLLSVFDV